MFIVHQSGRQVEPTRGCMWLIGGDYWEDPEPCNGPGKQTDSYPTADVSLEKTKAVPLPKDLGKASISLGKLSRQTPSSGPIRCHLNNRENDISSSREKGENMAEIINLQNRVSRSQGGKQAQRMWGPVVKPLPSKILNRATSNTGLGQHDPLGKKFSAISRTSQMSV